AGGGSVQRIYRAFLDPADVYFGLERKHLLRIDIGEWRRTLVSTLGALRDGATSLIARNKEAEPPAALWEELERLYDSLPAGLFTLEYYERFLEEFFVRRDIPNSFRAMPRELRIMAHDLDSGEQVLFGASGFDRVPVTRACIASMAVPPFFSPVRIGDRHYIDAGAGQISHLDIAVRENADVIVVINPMTPVHVQGVPTGHGPGDSIRDKGMMWVLNQATRIGMAKLMQESCDRIAAQAGAAVLLIEPDAADGILFMYNPANFSARRKILEHAYRSTRTSMCTWFEQNHPALSRAGWKARAPQLGT
ncbi:MAG TPA: patatin-like phospholipase family protein, partial [Polyangiaceae bacterium]